MISEVTRRNIIDFLVKEGVRWHGRLDELKFLSRVYQLETLPTTEHRKKGATVRDDIWQHRVRNNDWEDDWIFEDPRFGLLKGEDALFLRFLSEMLHPIVRPDSKEVNKLLNELNMHLRVDGFELVQNGEMSGRPSFVGQSIHARIPIAERIDPSPVVGGAGESSGVGSILLSPEEVAVLLKLDLPTVNGFLAGGDLRSVRLGTESRILADDVFHFLGEAIRKQQTELLKDRLSDPKTWARELIKDPVKRKEIEDSHYAAGSFGAFLKGGVMALKSEESTDSNKQLEDGTNVAAGTPFFEQPLGRIGGSWYVPSQGKATSRWKDNFTKLRTRFDRIIDEFCTSECFLVQTLIPAFDIASTTPPGILPDRQPLWRGPGLGREPARLIMPQKPLIGLFPIMNIRGEPMLGPDGSPTAFRLGLSRYFSVDAIPDGLRPLPIPQLTQLMGDGRNLLYQLPPEIAVRIWRNWLFGFSQSLQNDGPSLWLDALFEMSWQRKRGSPFRTERFAWHENGSVGLSGTRLFPRLPNFITSTPGEFAPHEHGYPRAFYSKISDVARASVAAIDEILEYETTSDVMGASKESSKSAPLTLQGSGKSVHDFSSYCEGDTEPSLNKRIRVLIDSDINYIVYLDQDLSVEYSWTEAYGRTPRGFPKIANELSHLESVSAHLLDRPWAEGFRRLLGEAMARIIGDKSVKEAQSGMGSAEAYLDARIAEERTDTTSPQDTKAKCKILFLAANPERTTQLALDEESREIDQKIRASDYRDSLELITKWAVRPDDLLQYLNQHKPHVVHFSSHGSPAEEVIFLDANRKSKPVTKAALKQLFMTLKDNIRIVVLNACYSRPQAEAIVETIDCAVGMKKAIGDEAAITFASSFYRALGFGRSVQEAFDQGKAALMLDGILEENTPDLLVRKGVDSKTVFLVEAGMLLHKTEADKTAHLPKGSR